MAEPLRIANCSGFFGDRFSAAKEMVDGGPIDVLTGEYLAELTMLILARNRTSGRGAGYATTFLKQMEEVLGTCAEKGIKVVTNAGGLAPAALADDLRELAAKLGITTTVAHIEGDDLMDRLADLKGQGLAFEHLDTGETLDAEPLTANAYLGGWGIAEGLGGGADIVVTGRVTDAALVVGPSAWRFGWARTDWDRIAGAIVAGHVIECGPQATGGNYSFFTEIEDLAHPGFPIAEMHEDGSSVITKHPGTGGQVSVGTVTAQLLYEIGPPAYPNPDAVALFDSISIEQEGEDRVRLHGIRGEPAPPTLKVCLNYFGGFRNDVTLVLTGLDAEAKARLVAEQLAPVFEGVEESEIRLVRTDRGGGTTDAEASAHLRITVKDADRAKVGRPLTRRIVELGLSSYPGFHGGGPPSDASAFGVHWPALIPAELVPQTVVAADGHRTAVAEPPRDTGVSSPHSASATPRNTGVSSPHSVREPDEMRRADPAVSLAPLGLVAGARSGDKGGNANVGVWARSDEAYAWLAEMLDVAAFKRLVPEADDLEVRRYELPLLRALNFVVVGLLGDGVAASTRPDPQAKGLGEFLRSRQVEIPLALMPERQPG